MKGFNFEKNLDHQQKAVESVADVFTGLPITPPKGLEAQLVNPTIEWKNEYYKDSLRKVQSKYQITEPMKSRSNIIDVMMETGTGKTYTYTKTMLELNKRYGMFKFVVVVPTLSIKAGTVNFLKSESVREHFKEQYGKTIELHVVESKKSSRTKKSYLPSAVRSFTQAGSFDTSRIHVLIINMGMINSDSMQESYHTNIFEKYSVPMEAIRATRPIMIMDEPHKFPSTGKTWNNLEKIDPQFIIRYGATFPTETDPATKKQVPQYENLVYTLTAVDAFHRNLVKGVVGHITEYETGKNTLVRLLRTEGSGNAREAIFELAESKTKSTYRLKAKESLEQIHQAMDGLTIVKLNKSEVLLSNGLSLRWKDTLNPYSYAEKVQESMMRKAIKNHFKIERELLTRDVRIKPLTLFFIDNIDEYREKKGSLRQTIEALVKEEVSKLLEEVTDAEYRKFLEATLENVSGSHGGYFSKDNSEKDEKIEKEINDILHDKESMLDLNNPRRFIFSKWTLREGWDNPNVFQICKLRSSGSENSKLQEVGRGLRLPVNEYGNRVKDEQFYLHYFVDFTESDFISRLKDEINVKSGALAKRETAPEKLDEQMIRAICEKYNLSEEDLLEELDDKGLIKRNNSFKDGGYEYISSTYPRIFEGVDQSKITTATKPPRTVRVRTEKYPELKALWEKLNERVILEYRVQNEREFQIYLEEFFTLHKEKGFFTDIIWERTETLQVSESSAESGYSRSTESESALPTPSMTYSQFLESLAISLQVNLKTLHASIVSAGIQINKYQNPVTIRMITQRFNTFLLSKAIESFGVEYHRVSHVVHPTKLTDPSGNVLTEIPASEVGVHEDTGGNVAKNYFLDEVFFDSDLERDNIKERIEEVQVFTKIPKNSIKIPVVGGKSYSPDFAYVLNYSDGKKKMFFVVETKNADEQALREEEKQKIKHAEKLFGGEVNITFSTQFQEDKIVDLLKKSYEYK